MLIWSHKISFYHLNKRILWKFYLLYTDNLIFQKYKKCSPGKYAMLLYVAGPYVGFLNGLTRNKNIRW